MQVWLSFIISLILIMFISRKSLWLGLLIGAIFLGAINLPFRDLYVIIHTTLIDQKIILLATAVGMIPLIGGGLQISGLMKDLVDNLQVKRRVFLGLSPALMGLLPIPGGALLSAPMLNRSGNDIKPQTYTVINIWFRHILILIYPLGSLLTCSKMGNFDVYQAMIFIFPIFLVLFILGYFFFLHPIKGDMPKPHKLNIIKLLIPLFVIISAPIIHTFLKMASLMDEMALVIAVTITLILTFLFGRMKPIKLFSILKKMKPWKYFLIIIAIFLFLRIFQATTISSKISQLSFSKNYLIIVIAGMLSFVTGRVQLPISILIPIFLTKFGVDQFTILAFVIMYVAVYLGYMISPVHPCIIVSLEYFKTSYWKFMKRAYLPTLIGFVLLFVFSLFVIN